MKKNKKRQDEQVYRPEQEQEILRKKTIKLLPII